jgi:carotenoid cleavage dioxygenase
MVRTTVYAGDRPTTGDTPGRPVRHERCTTTTPVDAPYGFGLADICHVDRRTGAETVWDPGDDLRGGEPVFVASREDEGEGWLLSYVWDRITDRSALAVFDAGAVADGPVGRVELPARVPFGFRGLWVDEAAL